MKKEYENKNWNINIMLDLNKTQTAAYKLIQSDARFLYSLVNIDLKAQQNWNNFIMMCQPYIGVFAEGAEQWSKKVGLTGPQFNEKEKLYYTALRQSHKLFEQSYDEYNALLIKKLKESDDYFYNNAGFLRKLPMEYDNVGTDLCNDKYCGNTVLCAAYSPLPLLKNPDCGINLKNLSVVAGKLAAFFGCKSYGPYEFDDKNNNLRFEDYHFFHHCPIKEKNVLNFSLFSILCSINYVTVFIDNCFVEEIPQKFKFAYLQYYYLCDFVKEINKSEGTDLIIDDSLKKTELRNCLAHYGLGKYLQEQDIISSDILKGLTNKALRMDYYEAKRQLYGCLRHLSEQIEKNIF